MLSKLFRRRPDFIIGDGVEPYLLRWWIIPRNRWFNIYLHKILKSDDDRALHDHPWWNLSIILKGGYYEVTGEPKSRVYACTTVAGESRFYAWRKPGSFTLRRADAAHRLELLHQIAHASARPCWTLFITGPRIREWGFHCPKGWVHWKDFVDKTAHGSVGRGCGEHG